MIQHDMMMFDHGMPRADSSLSKEIVELAQAIDTTFAPQIAAAAGAAPARAGAARAR